MNFDKFSPIDRSSLNHLIHTECLIIISWLIMTFDTHWGTSCHLYHVFTYNHSILIDKDLCECQNILIKFPCAFLFVSFIRRNLYFFHKSYSLLFLFLMLHFLFPSGLYINIYWYIFTRSLWWQKYVLLTIYQIHDIYNKLIQTITFRKFVTAMFYKLGIGL